MSVFNICRYRDGITRSVMATMATLTFRVSTTIPGRLSFKRDAAGCFFYSGK
ncbi:MAG: hypothetical protein L0241_24915 [Planctomycetia bacterium]|nr:hypothetical protein [Planctomycetia bacterium]